MSDFKQRLMAELNRDKKKTIALAAMMLVAVVVTGKMLLPKSTPSRANAAQSNTPAKKTAAAKKDSPAVTENQADAEKQAMRDEYIRSIDRTITRDIFEPSTDVYGSARDPQRSSMDHDDDTIAGLAEAKNQEVIKRSKSLTLQSTVFSETPTAMINNQVLRVGASIDGFEIIRIDSRSCTLKCEGVVIELEMN